MSANLTLLTLPYEVIIRIFGLLEGRQIAKCGAVCSYFKDAIENSIMLQYFIKLDIFGYVDGPGPAGAPWIPATRLEQLQRHIDAWNELDWVESRMSVPILHRITGALCEGIYMIADATEVACIQLPSVTRGIPLRTWKLRNFGFPVSEAEISPSNNLLVVLSDMGDPTPGRTRTDLHLRTLSDNVPHPRARSPVLFSVLTDVTYYVENTWVRIMGHLLGVLLYINDRVRIEIWDWTTCEKITMIESGDGEHPSDAFDSFEFLSATSFLLPHTGVLEVYQIPVETPGAIPIHTASFCMPIPALEGAWPGNLVKPTLRLPHDIRDIDDEGRLLTHSPFPPPSFRMGEDSHYIEISSGVRTLSVDFHIPLPVLRRSAMYENPLAIPWDAWSKDVFFMGPTMHHIEMCGGRLLNFRHSSGFCSVSLLDLNRYRAKGRRSTTAESSIYDQPTHVIESEILRDGRITMRRSPPVHSVASRAPSFKLAEGHVLRGVMCDEEHILARTGPATGFEDMDADEIIILTL